MKSRGLLAAGTAHPLLFFNHSIFQGLQFSRREVYREKLVAKRDFSRKSRSDRVSERASPLDLAASRAASATTRWVGIDKEALFVPRQRGTDWPSCGMVRNDSIGAKVRFPRHGGMPTSPPSSPFLKNHFSPCKKPRPLCGFLDSAYKQAYSIILFSCFSFSF